MPRRLLLVSVAALAIGGATWLAVGELGSGPRPGAAPGGGALEADAGKAASQPTAPVLRGRNEPPPVTDRWDVGGPDATAPGPGRVVRVRGPDGAPVGDGIVRVTASAAGFHSTTVVPIARGSALLPAGTLDETRGAAVYVDVHGPEALGLAPKRIGPVASLADLPEVVTLEAGVDITGVVTAPSGGVAGVEVTVRHADPERDRGGSPVRRVTTDTGGSFRARGLAAESYALSLKVPDAYVAPEAQRVRGGDVGVRIVLSELPVVRVTLLDGLGEPVVGASVGVGVPLREGDLRASTPWKQAETDDSGLAVVPGFETGDACSLSVHPPPDREDLLPIWLQDWQAEDTTFRMARAFTITGTVVDASGRRVKQARVSAWGVENSTYKVAEVGEDGTFLFTGLPAGTLELRVTDAEGHDLPYRTELTRVVAAGDADVVLRCDLGVEVTFVVRGCPLPPTGARARLIDEAVSHESMSAQVEADGYLRFGGVRADGTYTLWIHGLPGQTYVLESGIRAGTRDRVVEAREGCAIEGRVVYPDDAAPTMVFVVARQGLVQTTAPALGAGPFAVRGLPGGTWRLSVHLGADSGLSSRECEALCGDDVELVLQHEPDDPPSVRPPR